MSLRAERVSRPAIEKKRRRRVLVVTSLLTETDARCPTGQIMRQHLDGSRRLALTVSGCN